jgi:hypothetical protein
MSQFILLKTLNIKKQGRNIKVLFFNLVKCQTFFQKTLIISSLIFYARNYLGNTVHDTTTFSIMTLSVMTLSIMIFSIMTLSIMTLSIMTLSTITLSVMTLSTMTLSIKNYNA